MSTPQNIIKLDCAVIGDALGRRVEVRIRREVDPNQYGSTHLTHLPVHVIEAISGIDNLTPGESFVLGVTRLGFFSKTRGLKGS